VNGPGGIPPATNGIAITTAGNVGVGTLSPGTRFSLSGGPVWTSNFWTASMNLQNASAIGWEANPSGRRWGIGQTTGGLYFFRSFSSFGTTASPADYAMQISDDGNILQARGNNGLVKAMLVVNANGSIARCYNGITNSSTGNCGFTVTIETLAFITDYLINFGFQTNDRFVAVTPNKAISVNVTGTYAHSSANSVAVYMNLTDVDHEDSYVTSPFTIIVF
jgi:hypothetical protein